MASTPAFFAGFDAARAVVFAALRAFCWRPRAWPPFFAAALRLVEAPEVDELLRLLADVDEERLLAERALLARLPPDALARLPPDALARLPPDALRAAPA